ncbi:CDGSH iron-sulfur domain-containing protein [Streptomyces sp. HUAS MG47]|uniref:CDGSH iron-sulfur domain-containing protein n=1 Tax=Streptomyces solicamelliae TaxID=3231716 RepID=UPI003877DA49
MSVAYQGEHGPGWRRREPADARRVVVVDGGPLLIEGPVEIVLPDGETRLCERPVVALCTCRRSLRMPFCDTNHRPRRRGGAPSRARAALARAAVAEATAARKEGGP